MSLKYAVSITLFTTILMMSLTGIIQTGLPLDVTTSISAQSSAISLSVEKGAAGLHSTLACIGCSGGDIGPG